MNAPLPVPPDVKLMNLTASALFVGCAALLLAALVWRVLHAPAFALTRIVVEGELEHNNPVTLRANVAPQLTGNFFTMDLHAVRAAFEQVPWVRTATVRREFPASLRVHLQEYRPVAYWGPEGSTTMVDREGEVFEVNTDMVDEDLPRLIAPEGHALEMLQVHALLQPVFAPLGLQVQTLAQSGRGGWHATLDSGAVVELGSGTPQELVQRAQRFVRTVTSVAAHYGRRVDALESVDLRYPSGYALRLRGVSTVTEGAPPGAKPKSGKSGQRGQSENSDKGRH